MSFLARLHALFGQPSWKQRIRLATASHDCDDLPKVPGAGELTTWQGAPVQLMHNGVRVFAGGYHGAPMIEIIRRLRGHHEAQEERVFHEVLSHLPAAATMLEVGCFWAYYSLWFSHGQPVRRNFLTEPVEWKRRLAELNFALNKKSVTVDPYYVAYPGATLAQTTGAADESLCEAQPITVDDYLALKGIDRLAILHADIQGAELALLQGAPESLADHRIDYCFLSTHGEQHTACLALLEMAGYRIIAQHQPRERFSVDGLIVAAGHQAPFREPIIIGVKD
jgi:FkbM family methyltransferase